MLKHFLSISLITIAFSSCSNERNNNAIVLNTTDTLHNNTVVNEKGKVKAVVYGSAFDLDSTDFMLIPVGLKSIGELRAGDDVVKYKSYEDVSYADNSRISSGKYNFYSLSPGSCNNIIFYDKIKGISDLLIDQPAIINKFYFPYFSKEYSGEKFWFILFALSKSDFNNDGKIDGDDNEEVYWVDLNGKNRVLISPENSILNDWFVDLRTKNLILYFRVDSNNDKKFDFTDEIKIMKSSLINPQPAVEILDKDIKGKIKNILSQIK